MTSPASAAFTSLHPSSPASGGAAPRHPLAWRPVGMAMAALALLLAATSQGYGYHRDELYFRMLDPAWGYVDQPPLTPLLAHALASVVDEPWFLRVPAMLSAVATVLVAALLTREAGGARRAQSLSAWAAAAAAFPMVLGHVLLTASLDLVAWPLVCLFAIRALLRPDARAWLWVGLVAGVASYNRLLIAVLLIGVGLGLLAVGPWRTLRSPWLWAGVVLTGVIALPNVLYQATHAWPQFAMGAALAADNGGETRVLMWPLLLTLAGPLLVPIWVAGIVSLLRRPPWRSIRLLLVGFAVVLVFTFVGSAQFYYPLGMVSVLLALGCVPTADWMRTRGRRWLVWIAVALNGVVSALIALPLVPVAAVGATPIPSINQATADSVGWPEYVRQVAAVTPAGVPVITSNYGEAGAIARFGPALGLRAVYSDHNELWYHGHPPDTADSAVFVGYRAEPLESLFASCTVRARLDNGVGVDNEEQHLPVTVCTGRRVAWADAWPRFAHLD
ncbi:glycosyltransferase family 39 protein [Rathayibacter sp. YIM 133350]|uniref:glycosyltransferase family 39 protein n=1 Tax=Rathayibacter sp. YIM 133350 TaxID=3131992 RepID=UPI00307F3AF0